MTVVPFSIDARQPDAFTLWKASEKSPLLVFDPSHTGRVTSAKQLFGTYAFGGRTTKAAYSPSNKARAPWGNGYQALALLDANHDGKISGKEVWMRWLCGLTRTATVSLSPARSRLSPRLAW